MLVSFMKKLTDRFAAVLLGMLCFVGCSSSDSGSKGVPLSAPGNMALTAKSGELLVQFSRVAGIGAEGSEKYPSYEVSIGTREDGSDKVLLSPEVNSGSSNLVQFTITRAAASGQLGVIYEYPTLEDGKEYWIFVRSNFASADYGYSGYTKLQAVPIPMPTAVDNATVTAGDKRIVVSWTAKPYEEYGVNMDDCPKNAPAHLAPDFWKPVNFTSGDNYVFTVDNNTATHKLCVIARNVNGDGAWHIFGTVPASGSIVYDTYKGEDAATAPDTPAVTLVKNANKRVDLSFPAVLTGAKSVSDYQYAYKESGAAAWSSWESVLITSLTNGIASLTVANLANDKTYDIKVRAVNSVSSGSEGSSVQGTPKYTDLNFNNPDEYLSKANAEFIYAEDVPHSDFWRISTTYKKGGRTGTDRLVRGKETALGNLYADAVQWYAKERGYNTDFAWLVGTMINTGIQRNQTITPKFLQGVTNQDYADDPIVIVSLKGSDLISTLDYNLDLDNYPAVGTNNGYASTLLGQAAAVYRNGHYGGSGGTTYNGVYWGMPSKEVRYTIKYKDYSLDAFNAHFTDNISRPGCVAARNANDGTYDSVNDPLGCYLMPYTQASPVSGDPGEGSVMGYKRGRIKDTAGTTINGVAIDQNKTYKIATTKKIADSLYLAFLKGSVQNTGVPLVRAVAEYIYNNGSAGMNPTLDGRVKIEGGVPGNSAGDFK